MFDFIGALGRIRTSGLLVRSRAVYAFFCINLTASEIIQPGKKSVENKQKCGYPAIKGVHLFSPRASIKRNP
ncbi:MAG: hypothetical protein H7836_14915 [Magnetococcus sp. YQC-3]